MKDDHEDPDPYDPGLRMAREEWQTFYDPKEERRRAAIDAAIWISYRLFAAGVIVFCAWVLFA